MLLGTARSICLLVLLLISVPSVLDARDNRVEALRAWFTDADLPRSSAAPAPDKPLPAVPGSEGQGVRLARPVAVRHTLYNRESGLISFWLNPDWHGDDGLTHRLLWNGAVLRITTFGTLVSSCRHPG